MIGTPWNTQANLKHRRRGNQPLLDHLFGETNMSQLKHFQFGLHAPAFDQGCHLAQIGRCRDVNVVAITEVHGAAIKATNLRAQ